MTKKQFKFPLSDEWINKMCYMYTIVNLSGHKLIEVLLLYEIKQTMERKKNSMISLTYEVYLCWADKSQRVVEARESMGKGKMESLFNVY